MFFAGIELSYYCGGVIRRTPLLYMGTYLVTKNGAIVVKAQSCAETQRSSDSHGHPFSCQDPAIQSLWHQRQSQAVFRPALLLTLRFFQRHALYNSYSMADSGRQSR